VKSQFSASRLRWLLPLLVITASLACNEPENKLVRRTQFIMGTLVEITLRERENSHKFIDQAFEEMTRLEKLMSHNIPGSEISKINAHGNEAPVPVSAEVLQVIERGIYWGQRSEGMLDISIDPLQKLWQFDEEHKAVPPQEDLALAVSRVDFQNIKIADRKIQLKEVGMSLHLGAIAKGYAVDRALELLARAGLKNALVNAGGDLAAIGGPKDGLPWKIGLQHPRKPEAVIAELDLSSGAVATSGDYQKYFILDGTRYHHVINPRTGWPAAEMVSATVIAKNTMDADALATAVFVLGVEKGLALIEKIPEAEAMLVMSSGEFRISSGLKNKPGFQLKNW
jgi:thiamine biosynthesis lipoprotein